MHTFQLHTRYLRVLADTVTPVGLYLRLRDRYDNCLLLESSDYHGQQNAFSYLAFDPLARFELRGRELTLTLPDDTTETELLDSPRAALARLQAFAASFQTEDTGHDFITGGLFGYLGYEAVQAFEDLTLNPDKQPAGQIPDILYGTYRYVIAINHFRNELYVFEHTLQGQEVDEDGLTKLVNLIRNPSLPDFKFRTEGEERTNQTDEEFLKVLAQGQQHCLRGDVFQIVLSRRFQQGFSGDEFNVYRALRSINPSPYLFYFDYGSFKIFGSSPEAQVRIQGREASLFPIAGTFRRTGHDAEDAALAQKLADDPKENAEHVMLVDLARNDLARHGDNVRVKTFREIQFYSHVIHLVSEVNATLAAGTNSLQVVADTFPAGTLSGAPKHRAMQLIDGLEPTARGYYGGAIGHLGFNGDFNHAIMIRSFLSTADQLYFQAGAGVVAASDINSELNEVHHKLAALRKALQAAEAI
ncbi:anthranilate synthase component I family protein [Hymenobacter lutimineralis]|uniref:Anthranilate synthase component 1 n=1 Tax=Hymenobacter lutimineralis TaxID=2606448 RepID=A0A5D6V5D4_9BACT|nr:MULTISPECIES: anthranilate synthase component I family protein [Hymenobacter]QIX62977.1 anthranilate synthase component I family protein [Hymenobacter sp. BT18]TYZ10467.1 anthranilate synthase component I family protein [Hymenobacter lutimineralis]